MIHVHNHVLSRYIFRAGFEIKTYQTETYQIPQTGVLKFVVSDPDKNKQLLVRIN